MPDTSAYYYAAYAVVAILYAGYAASIWVRARRLGESRRALAERAGESGTRAHP